MESKNKTLLNIVMFLIFQMVLIISNFIIPRIILLNYGSEINGLVLSITQFLNYINLFEGGVSGVVLAALYKPLSEKNIDEISSVINTAELFFKKIGKYFLIYTIGIAVLFPFFVKINLSYFYILILVLVISISIFIQYYYALVWKLLLQADKKSYVSSYIQIFITILLLMISAYFMYKKLDIIFVKMISAGIFILQPLLYTYYIGKRYIIKKSKEINNSLLAQRWEGFGINVAAFIHNNTDIVLITLFLTLKDVSVYSIYYLIVYGIKTIITSISTGFSPILGNLYAKNKKAKLNIYFSIYEYVIYFFSFLFFSVASENIFSFIENYTRGVTDTEYHRVVFAYLMILSYLIFCLREPYINMAYSSGAFKKVTKFAYMEAIINLILSLISLKYFGLCGVAIGTLISILYRTLAQIYFLRKNILYRKYKFFLKNVIIFVSAWVISHQIIKLLVNEENINTWLKWTIYSIKVSTIVFIVQILISILFYRKQLKKYRFLYCNKLKRN